MRRPFRSLRSASAFVALPSGNRIVVRQDDRCAAGNGEQTLRIARAAQRTRRGGGESSIELPCTFRPEVRFELRLVAATPSTTAGRAGGLK